MLNFRQYKVGFTLAEVLITLGIIGVVAAITIPVLMAKINEQVHKAQLKKVMSTLNQSLKMVYNNTDTIYDCYYGENGVRTTDNDCTKLNTELKQVLKISHICENKSYEKGCIPKYKGKDTVLKETFGDDYNLDSNNKNCGALNEDFILNKNRTWVLLDGTIIGQYMNPRYIYVDVNGNKGPNRWGYDIFILKLVAKNDASVAYYPECGGCGIVEKGGKSPCTMLGTK